MGEVEHFPPPRMAHFPAFPGIAVSRTAILGALSILAGLCLLFFWSFAPPGASAAEEEQADAVGKTGGRPETHPGNQGRQGVDARGRPQWLELEPGLDFCEFRLNGSESKITALRIDPENFDFVLGASSEDGRPPRSLDQWAREYGLKAAINASMYLPDGRTSTGYMRNGGHINNPRIMQRFGAFFVASPRREGIPRAGIIDRDHQDWRARLDDYDLAIQNYRMTNTQRRILWSPGGPLYSISAVAQDGSGRILFLHSRMPVEAYDFVQQILHLPLDARTVMYVEGGAQAGLLVHSENLKKDLAVPHPPSLLVTGNLKAVLPNILGIKPRPQKINID